MPGNGERVRVGQEQTRKIRGRRWDVAVVCAAGAALAVKLLLAWNTYGTNDVYAWERFMLGARYIGSSVYRAYWDFNHPPFMIHFLRFLGWFAGA